MGNHALQQQQHYAVGVMASSAQFLLSKATEILYANSVSCKHVSKSAAAAAVASRAATQAVWLKSTLNCSNDN